MLDDVSPRTTATTPSGAPEKSEGALTVVPRDEVEAMPRRLRRRAGKAIARREPKLDTALATDDRDAERVAFALWREGRTDEAIAFLEREILLEKDRAWKEAAFAGRQEPHFEKPAPEVIVTPAPPAPEAVEPKRGRKRGRSATPVSEPSFSDASAPLIELPAERIAVTPAADALPVERRTGRGPAIVAAIGLVVVGAAAAANYWDGHRDALKPERVAPAIETEAGNAAALPPATEVNQPTLATMEPAVAAEEPATVAAIPAPQESEDASAEELPPPALEDEETVALAEPEPEEPDFADAATPPDEPDLADSVTPPQEVDEGAVAPEPPLVARLPRQRPEPPANIALVVPPPARAEPVRVEPPEPASEDVPLYDMPAEPFYGPDGRPVQQTLTPAEYQALLERRAIAEEYVAQQRAIAEEPVPPARRLLLRLLRR
jgi:hypothetical protein